METARKRLRRKVRRYGIVELLVPLESDGLLDYDTDLDQALLRKGW